MTLSPLEKIRERGVLGLGALGEEVPDFEPARPVAFRLLMDGEPPAGIVVAFSVSRRASTAWT